MGATTRTRGSEEGSPAVTPASYAPVKARWLFAVRVVSPVHGSNGMTAMMRPVHIAVGSDHAGYPLKEHLAAFLQAKEHEVLDLGTDSTEPVDYPAIAARVARAVTSRDVDRGIIIGGSGQGEQMAANKVPGTRAALCNDLYTARLSRAHNDANVLAMGARIIAAPLAEEIVAVWLETTFDGGRHQRRINQFAELEDQS